MENTLPPDPSMDAHQLIRTSESTSAKSIPDRPRRQSIWEAKKTIIRELYVIQNLPLKDVMSIMLEKYSFNATVRMYERRIVQWNLWKHYSQDLRTRTNDTKEGKERKYSLVGLSHGLRSSRLKSKTYPQRHLSIQSYVPRASFPASMTSPYIRVSLPELMPELLEGFAIGVGVLPSQALEQIIMHILRRGGRFAVEQFITRSLLADQNQACEDMAKKTNGNTTCLAKNSSSLNGKHPAANAQAQGFDERIMGMKAQGLFSLYWNDDQECTSANAIREELSNLSARHATWPQSSPTFQVRFRFAGCSFADQVSLENAEAKETLMADQLESMIVISCGRKAQTITVEGYMAQIWPLSCRKIFDLLIGRVNGEYGDDYVVSLSDSTQMAAAIERGNLVVRVRGTPAAIANCGEQLSWLRAVLVSGLGDNHSVIGISPFIVDVTEYEYTTDNGQSPSLDFSNSIGYAADYDVDARVSLPTNAQLRWSNFLKRSIAIVSDYPVLFRPVGYPGIEITGQHLVCLLGEFSAFNYGSKTILRGSRTSVELVKSSYNIYHWRWIEDFPDGSFVLIDDFDDTRDLQDSRHIIMCDNLEYHVQEEATEIDEINTSNLDGLQNEMTDNEIADELRKRIGSRGISNLPNHRDLLQLDRSELEGGSLRSLVSEAPTTPGLESRIFYDSNSSDFDSDSFSASVSSSGSLESLDDVSHLGAITRAAALRLVEEFRASIRGRNTTERGSQVVNPGANKGHARTSQSISSKTFIAPSTKRKDRHDDDDEPNENFRPCLPKVDKPAYSKTFACPFWKLDPLKHRACCKLILSRVSDVKQHIRRKHTPEFYCDRCSTIFLSEATLKEHVSQADGLFCTPCSQLEGITRGQRYQLSRKSNKSLSEEKQWHAMWDIVFPEFERPVSAFMDPEISEDLHLFRTYCRNHSASVLATEIEAAQPLTETLGGHDISDEQWQRHLQSILAIGLDRLFEQWYSSRPSGTGTPKLATSRIQTTEFRHSNPLTMTPRSSVADSDIGTCTDVQSTTDVLQSVLQASRKRQIGPLSKPQAVTFDEPRIANEDSTSETFVPFNPSIDLFSGNATMNSNNIANHDQSHASAHAATVDHQMDPEWESGELSKTTEFSELWKEADVTGLSDVDWVAILRDLGNE